MKSVSWKDICFPKFTGPLFTTAKIRKQPTCPPMDGLRKYIYNGILRCLKKGNLIICDTVDKLGGYRVSEIKSDTERQTLHDPTYMWKLRRKRKLGRCWSKGTKFQWHKMSQFWRANMQLDAYSEQHCTGCLTFAKRQILEAITKHKDKTRGEKKVTV